MYAVLLQVLWPQKVSIKSSGGEDHSCIQGVYSLVGRQDQWLEKDERLWLRAKPCVRL